MEIPSKIYVRPNDSDDCPSNTGAGNLIMAHTEKIENDVEFTNLSEAWHDAKKKKHPEGVCGNNPVVFIGLRKGRISYRYLWEDMEDCWLDIDTLVECKAYDKALWAYLIDLVPGVKPKGL